MHTKELTSFSVYVSREGLIISFSCSLSVKKIIDWKDLRSKSLWSSHKYPCLSASLHTQVCSSLSHLLFLVHLHLFLFSLKRIPFLQLGHRHLPFNIFLTRHVSQCQALKYNSFWRKCLLVLSGDKCKVGTFSSPKIVLSNFANMSLPGFFALGFSLGYLCCCRWLCCSSRCLCCSSRSFLWAEIKFIWHFLYEINLYGKQ